MKTKFWKIIEESNWLQHRLYRAYGISPRTVNKAINWDESIFFSSKEKIYNALIELNAIKQEEMTINDLFSEEEAWEDNKETSMNLQEVI